MSESHQIITVHVTPRSGRDELVGLRADANGDMVVQVKVKAAPEGGKANTSVCAVIAKALGVSKRDVEVYRGGTARTKLVSVDCSQPALDAWLASLPVV